MKINQGINARMKNVMKKVVFLNVLAEEQAPVEPPVDNNNQGEKAPQAPVVNYEDLIAKARREEKDKLYGQIKAKDAKINDLTEKNNALMLKVGQQETIISEKDKEIAKLKAQDANTDNEKIKALEAEKKQLQKELDQVKANMVDPQALEAQIRGEYDVKMYRVEKLANNSDIIPELVTGNTKEEIDASFEVAKARYAEIVGKVQQNQAPTNTMPKLNTDFSQLSTKSINPDDVANMSMADYAEFRKKLGLR